MTPPATSASESVARRKIREAAERQGLVIEQAYWAPVGAYLEKMGPTGGWVVFFEDKDDGRLTAAHGYNWREVVSYIDTHAEPPSQAQQDYDEFMGRQG